MAFEFRYNSKKPQATGSLALLAVLAVWIVVLFFNLLYNLPSSTLSDSIVSDALFRFKNGGSLIKRQSRLPDYHVIFSTGCSLQQHWESYVFFYHAHKVKQPGNITRLVSGCDHEEEKKLRRFHEKKIKTISDRFHVFFTPEFGTGGTFRQDYKYNNKPNSVYLWMKETLGMDQTNRRNETDDGIILLLDPDMVLLRPLLHDFSDQTMIYASTGPEIAFQPNGTNIVKHGMPMAQQDGYLDSVWMKFNAPYITQGGRFPQFAPNDGPMFWNSGPPYLSTVRDMWNMASLWKEYVPRVYEEYPKLFAEMFGLIIAAVHLGLPHTLVKSIVVSEPYTPDREGWAFVDALSDDEVCDVDNWSKNPNMPVVLHYCKRYALGKFFFSKYRLKKRYISCETPLLTMPPRNAHQIYDYWSRPPPDRGQTHEMTVENVTTVQAKRQAFMLCGLIHSVNEAARYYKMNHCHHGNANFSEVYNFHDDPYSE